jgi:hypothetical protein
MTYTLINKININFGQFFFYKEQINTFADKKVYICLKSSYSFFQLDLDSKNAIMV